MAKQDDYVRITIRIPREVHAQLAAICAKEPHSLNAEIIRRVSDSFREEERLNQVRQYATSGAPSDKPPGDTIRDKMQSLAYRIEQDAVHLSLLTKLSDGEKGDPPPH